MHTLYPAIEPFRTHRLAVDARHTVHIEECGNPDAVPVVFLHGGPGAGIVPDYRRYFHPERWHVVLFDQRGAGQSTPFADLVDNTTAHLVADIEAIREELGIERWVVFGGSWGSTLALAYAEAHPERVLGLVLRGIFLARDEELRWFNEVDGGARHIFPERWARYRDFIPEAERGDMIAAYWKRLDGDDEDVRLAAAKAWSAYEGGSTTLVHDPDAPGDFDEPHKAVSLARLEAHYFRHRMFLEPNQLLRDAHRLARIPTTIVHGRYDIICPVSTALDLAAAMPHAALHIVLAGHSAADPAIVDQLVGATDLLAERYC
ncbi:MAG: prolyl aminopeptidase [Rhodanobacter sp.]|nr:MAG: prolyl aminopeptidase [Rhodanobacter sp.]TAM07868.1 MAG: prolyl aminopeptidase [Rhodanobacter sp.]TAM35050.1 MAG: prolyl aminopeptidase [Rhodanobacter sp.]